MSLCPAAERLKEEMLKNGVFPAQIDGYNNHLRTCPVCGGEPEIQIRADRFAEKKKETGFWATLVKSR